MPSEKSKPVKKRKRRTTVPKKECPMCNQNLNIEKYYDTNNPIFPDGKLNVCKPCFQSMVDISDVNSVIDALRKVDKPFIRDLWYTSMNNKRGLNPFGDYMKNVNSLHQYRNLTFADSVMNERVKADLRSEHTDDDVFETDIDSMEEEVVNIKVDYKVTPEMVKFWGKGYKPEQLNKLQDLYEDMKTSYEIETASHEDYLKKICYVSLEMETAIKSGMIDEFKKLSDAYDKLMRSAKFTAVQRSASDKVGGMNTFGEWFEVVEKDGFIPKFHHDEAQDIVDTTINNMMDWTRKLVLGDSNLAVLVEEAIKKMAMNSDELEDEDPYENIEEENLGEHDGEL